MTIRGFILGTSLLALVGWCLVQESVSQTRARYKLAELSRREVELKEQLARLKTEEESLRSPSRLATMVRNDQMKLYVLRTAPPESGRTVAVDSARRPGQVLDTAFIRVHAPVHVASVGDR